MPLDPEYEMTRPRLRVSSGDARSDGSDEGEIRVTQGFVSVAMRRGLSQLIQTEYPQGVKRDYPDEFAMRVNSRISRSRY
jgi:hypothetical protein